MPVCMLLFITRNLALIWELSTSKFAPVEKKSSLTIRVAAVFTRNAGAIEIVLSTDGILSRFPQPIQPMLAVPSAVSSPPLRVDLCGIGIGTSRVP